jgi:hypothetical protein
VGVAERRGYPAFVDTDLEPCVVIKFHVWILTQSLKRLTK